MKEHDDLFYIVKQSGQMPVVSYVPAYGWRCKKCGWMGFGLSEKVAIQEVADHLWIEHNIAGCHQGEYGGPHIFNHVKGSDSVYQCERCHWQIGK